MDPPEWRIVEFFRKEVTNACKRTGELSAYLILRTEMCMIDNLQRDPDHRVPVLGFGIVSRAPT